VYERPAISSVKRRDVNVPLIENRNERRVSARRGVRWDSNDDVGDVGGEDGLGRVLRR
jgi:hypothetical protein